ncbi:MAG TPA: polymer-forming cytoskeletal protein [Clostridiaceae bacterium]
MFIEKSNKLDKIETLIGDTCYITGIIKGNGLLKIDGNIDGDILWQDDIIIGNSALCKSNLSCKNAIIDGTLLGNVFCEQTLVISSKGKITGDLTVENLVVKEGGFLDGKCTMVVKRDSQDLID